MINMNKTDLSAYQQNLKVNASLFKQITWYFVNILFFKSSFFAFYKPKTFLLKVFGAQVGRGVVIKPSVNIKYPWFLKLGNHSWIGENVWIDNLTMVDIGDHVCISQGALLLCGNHDYTKIGFDLMVKPIFLREGVWIGAKAVVCGGVIADSHAVLSVSSVATENLLAYSIYKGNPAQKIKERIIVG